MENFKKFLIENDEEQDRTLDTSDQYWYNRTPSWFNELVNEALEQVLDVGKLKTIFLNIYEQSSNLIEDPQRILEDIMIDPSVSQEIKDKLVQPMLDDFIEHNTMTVSSWVKKTGKRKGYRQKKAAILQNLIDNSGSLMLVSTLHDGYEGIENKFRSSLESHSSNYSDTGLPSVLAPILKKLLTAVRFGNIGSNLSAYADNNNTQEVNVSLIRIIMDIVDNIFHPQSHPSPHEILSDLEEEVRRLIGTSTQEGEITKQFRLSNPEFSNEQWFKHNGIMYHIVKQSLKGVLGPRESGFDNAPAIDWTTEVANHLVQQSGNTN